MPSTAAIANPSSHSQAFLTFWATARTARGTACGTAGLVGLDIARSVPAGLVAELRSKLRPRSVDRRFSARSIRQRLGDNVAHYDQAVLPHQLRGLDMQVVPTRIGDFGVNSPCAFLVAGALRLGQRALVFLERAFSILRPSDSVASVIRPRSTAILPAPQVWLSAISTCRLRYQRPRASCAKHPVLILPSTGRLRQSR